LSSPEVDGRDERRKVLVVINPRYGLRNLAIKPVGDLANALHIASKGLSAQRTCDGEQICLWPAFLEHGLERLLEWPALGPAAGVARLAFLERTPDAGLALLEASANPPALCYPAVLSGWRR
jgi:hypothetical protein